MLVLIFLTIFVTCTISKPVDLQNGTIINKKYVVHEFIQRGTHASVYKVTDNTTNKIWAMKIQETKRNEISLSVEYDFYKRLQCTDAALKLTGLPLVGEYNTYNQNEFLILEHFDQCLCDEKLSEADGLDAMVQVISILQYIHSKGVIHRDIKTENMMIRDGKIVLIDFTDAQIYSSEEKTIGIYVGTFETAPLRAHELKNQDQKCDLESWGYDGMNILHVTMPFDKTGIDYEKKDRVEILYKEKLSFLSKGRMKRNFRNGAISGLFAIYFEYLQEKLGFGQTPDYNKLRDIFQNKWAEIKQQMKKAKTSKPPTDPDDVHSARWRCWS